MPELHIMSWAAPAREDPHGLLPQHAQPKATTAAERRTNPKRTYPRNLGMRRGTSMTRGGLHGDVDPIEDSSPSPPVDHDLLRGNQTELPDPFLDPNGGAPRPHPWRQCFYLMRLHQWLRERWFLYAQEPRPSYGLRWRSPEDPARPVGYAQGKGQGARTNPALNACTPEISSVCCGGDQVDEGGGSLPQRFFRWENGGRSREDRVHRRTTPLLAQNAEGKRR